MATKFLRLFLIPPALLAVCLIRLLSRFGYQIRIGEFWSDRIGHLAGNTECYLSEKDAGLSSGIDFWFHSKKPANQYLADMYARIMRVDRTGFVRIVALVNALFPGYRKHLIEPIQYDRDIFNLWERFGPHLKLTAEEEARGQAQLKAWGLPEGAKFVTLIVRDSAYLPELGYHRFRDSDIQTYRKACEALSERGYYVFRMGVKVNQPLLSNNPRVIDFATNGMYSEFMSIYLGAKCEFCVSTGTGYDAIPAVFQRPICYVNYVPVEYLMTFTNSLAIWKRHFKDGREMSFKEIIDSGAGQFMKAEDFEEAGIKLVDNTPEEIRDAVIEMMDLDYDSVANSLRQAYFWNQFPRAISPYNKRPLHGQIRMRIGSKFLDTIHVELSKAA